MAYATPANVYARALPAAAFAARPRTVEGADVTTGVLTLTGNGLALGTALRFSIEGQASFGATANALPGGLSLPVVYTAAPASGSSDLFQVAPVNGSLITSFTSAPVGVFAIVVDPLAMLLECLTDSAARIDQCLSAQSPPLKVDPLTGTYPQHVIGLNARMAARQAVVALGLANPQYTAQQDQLFKMQAADDAQLLAWVNGQPILPQATDQNTIADDAMRARGRRPIGWLRGGGCCGRGPSL